MELAKADASIAITVAAHTSLGTMPIVLSGSDEQKKKYVPKLASGEILGSFGLTEPEAGSDAVRQLKQQQKELEKVSLLMVERFLLQMLV
jgi:Acyl-CoA dehydrogenases